MTRPQLFALALLLVPAPASAMVPPSCEPADAFQKLDQVPALRKAHRFPDATVLVNQVLAADPANRHAKYSQALIAMDQSAANTPPFTAALTALARLADSMPDYAKLPVTLRNCPENAKLYTIFNTLGVQYAQSGDKVRAEQYFLRGVANQAPLAADSKSKLNYNLGVYYTHQLSFDKAARFYSAAGTPAAASQIQVINSVRKPPSK